MGLFDTKEFIERDKEVLRAFGVDPEGAEQIRMPRTSSRREIFNKSEANRQRITEVIATIAEKHGGAGVAFDHKSIARHHVNGDTDTILGISLQITDKDGKTHCYLLAFEHTEGEEHGEAVETVKRVLTDFGLLDAVQSGLLTLATDYALHGAAKRLSFNAAVDPNHSIDRLLKRTVKHLIPHFSESAVSEFEKVNKLTKYAKKNLTRAELRRLPASTAVSLNEYLNSKGLASIHSYTEVRFRSLYQNVSSINAAKSVILELVGNEDDPNHFHVANLPDFAFVEALHHLLENAFIPLINFCDSQQTSQCGEYLPEAEFLLQYACSDVLSDNQYATSLKDSLVAAVLEQLIGHYIVEDETLDSRVRTRLTPNELVVTYGTISRKSCNLEKVQWILKEGGRTAEAKLIKRFANEKNLIGQARIQIKKFDTLINGDSSAVVDFDSEDSCLSDDSSQNVFSVPEGSINSSRSFNCNRTEIEKEMDKWETLEIAYWKSFKICKFNFH